MTVAADLAVIGAGPGGYVAALRGAQLGAKVVLIERDRVGGVCLNWGCIPTKALLRTAEVLELVRDSDEYGVRAGDVRLDWERAQRRKEGIVRRLTSGVKLLLDRAQVQMIAGSASFGLDGVLQVETAAGRDRVIAQNYVIATGSRAATVPIPGLDGPGVLDSDGALAIDQLPASILIVGAGPVGVEFARLFRACGVQVWIVEVLSRILPTLDADVSAEVDRGLRKARVKVHTGTRVTNVTRSEGKLKVTILAGEDAQTITVDRVLLAAGRRPNLEGLALDAIGVETNHKGIVVDRSMRTTATNVYAVGDVTGGHLLAHVASYQGVVAAESASGLLREVDDTAIPSCVFSSPEVASVGLTEQAAQASGFNVRVAKFPFRANGKALAYGEHDGFAKVLFDGDTERLVGMHIVGPHASDLIQEGILGVGLGLVLTDLQRIVHPHPTLSEALSEAYLAAEGRALHGA